MLALNVIAVQDLLLCSDEPIHHSTCWTKNTYYDVSNLASSKVLHVLVQVAMLATSATVVQQ